MDKIDRKERSGSSFHWELTDFNVYMCNDGIEVESETNYFLHETDKCAHNKRTSSCGSKLLAYILKTGIIERPSNRPETLESIQVVCRNDANGILETGEFLKSPTVIYVRRLLILRQFNTVLVLDLMKRWIKHDVQIGQTLFCHTLYPTTFRNFFTLFGDRVVKSEDNYIRIRTDNESKHILIRTLPCKKHAQSLSCHVIPSEQTIIEKEDDYYTSYDLLHYDETDDDDFDLFDELGFFDDDSDEEDSDVEDYGFNDDELDDEEDEESDYVQ
ncbi:hypothetical protein CRE_22628 [Caenorhabditis remanei]|uniref:DUF38 domain-containing protein n=1 Tax=Caenorhabditis remanei TaxID=31234 RepID=E3N8M9_CAERE|nr:hypothetical protein CRE_22628 [Caenorhabditis remanei]